MKIEKNWFYKLSEIYSKEITIWDNLLVSIFDDLNKDLNIEIWENSRLEFYWLINKAWDTKVKFFQNKINSKLKVRYLLISKDSLNNSIKSMIFSSLWADYTKSDIRILSLALNDWFIDLDWIIEIDKWIKKVDWNLIEENLFLWESWKIKWIPTLLVWSSDVKASHSCKMERISDDKLFYLRSRGVWKENALIMMIEAKIVDLFSCISMLDREFYDKLIRNILEEIK